MQIHALEIPMRRVPEPFGAGAIKWLVAEAVQLGAATGLPIGRSEPVISVATHPHKAEIADIESMLNVAVVIDRSAACVELRRRGTEPDCFAVSQIHATIQAAHG